MKRKFAPLRAMLEYKIITLSAHHSFVAVVGTLYIHSTYLFLLWCMTNHYTYCDLVNQNIEEMATRYRSLQSDLDYLKDLFSSVFKP